jgi:hypothetical protein
MAQLNALPLDHLADGHGGGNLTAEVTLSIGGLKLTHQRNGNHGRILLIE